MTVNVGVLCDDGVVIGSDSAATLVAGRLPTIEHEKVLKIEVHGGNVITATTGSVGLAQRFNRRIKGVVNKGDIVKGNDPVEIGTALAELAIGDFRRTPSVTQNHPELGWGLGALIALPINQKPELFEFDPVQFSPERKGDPDTERGDRSPRYVSMGSGQNIADPFLGLVYHVFWKDGGARVADAKLAVAWALHHTIRVNTGGVGGPLQMATLEKDGNNWKAEHVDEGEVMEQVQDLEDYLRTYEPAMRAKAEAADTPPAPKPRA